MKRWGEIETNLRRSGCTCICGVDEAGRGPLAGPVIAAAVILPPGFASRNIDDSKRLRPHVREELYDYITENARDYAIASSSPAMIDRINILQATFTAMRNAVKQLRHHPDYILVDGNMRIPRVEISQKAIVKGDQTVLAIACASILAKVTRDRIMCEYHRQYPQYGFDRHKGYPTPQHRAMIEQYGAIDIHRRSFTLLAGQYELTLNSTAESTLK
ncbi:MAG: ribonuclease HII [Candidatus Zixiibacteriota bacterium]